MNIRFVPFSQWDRDVKTKFYTLVIAAVMVAALLTGLSMCAPAAKSKGGTPQVAATTHTPTPTAKPLAAGLVKPKPKDSPLPAATATPTEEPTFEAEPTPTPEHSTSAAPEPTVSAPTQAPVQQQPNITIPTSAPTTSTEQHPVTQPTTAQSPETKVRPHRPRNLDRSNEAYYRSCRDAYYAGATPIYWGQPGYRRGLDPNGNGIACESWPRR
ncbi:MAG: excalibur calcium-binding domain-containing protein [Actinomyces graevenitzii]|nr:excalibur calcium-binding domain-containing protein [Actinomyces graevenitzii]